MNSKPHLNGAPQSSRLALVFTSLINSCAVASEMALLAPPSPHGNGNGAHPVSSPQRASGLHTVGAGR